MDYYYRYGTRQTTEACPEAVLVMSIQSIVGVVISSCMAGIVFAKLARPKNRSHTVMFSKNAVVTQARSSFLCIFFFTFLGHFKKLFEVDPEKNRSMFSKDSCEM